MNKLGVLTNMKTKLHNIDEKKKKLKTYCDSDLNVSLREYSGFSMFLHSELIIVSLKNWLLQLFKPLTKVTTCN